MEEQLKLPCALLEFNHAPEGGETPCIVGFREHIFSTIAAMGGFAGGAELAFGTLVQRTLAYPLWSRLHYGHPDMLDKLAMIGQGGMSKGDKLLNVSEDIYAGMDATLRGRYIRYCDYYQVGKGRDMGFREVLGFFRKLACGTANQTTTRQAFRLAERSSFARNMSFYYGGTISPDLARMATAEPRAMPSHCLPIARMFDHGRPRPTTVPGSG